MVRLTLSVRFFSPAGLSFKPLPLFSCQIFKTTLLKRQEKFARFCIRFIRGPAFPSNEPRYRVPEILDFIPTLPISFMAVYFFWAEMKRTGHIDIKLAPMSMSIQIKLPSLCLSKSRHCWISSPLYLNERLSQGKYIIRPSVTSE